MKSARDPVDHVRVCCRVRPLNPSERQMHKELCVDYPGHSTDTIECRTTTTTTAAGAVTSADGVAAALAGSSNLSGSNGVERHTFSFSRVFRPEAGQADVYEHVARPIVADVMSGYNGTIFMYGQTGSGKTHTMFGDMRGGAWAAGGEEAHALKPSAEPSAQANEEEEESCGVDARRSLCQGEDDDDEEEQNENSDDEEAVRPSLAVAGRRAASPESSSSFCRARATVTPLGELRQTNSLQNTAGVATKQCKSGRATCVATSAVAPPTSRACDGAKGSAAQESRHRAALAKDSMSGVIPRAVHDIFQFIADADPSTEFDVQMFFVEVYMEQIRDLLAPASTAAAATAAVGLGGESHSSAFSSRCPARKLQLREDVSTNAFYIEGCRTPHVSSAREVLQLVKAGLKYRATSATAMNETSSRSHCLLNLTVKSVHPTRCVSTVGKLYLVDLAGSEKVGKTNATGLRLEEAKLINKSLSTLGMVIMSLTDQSATHTPYRNSVLTKILKDSLGGNSHTALVICCSPSPYNAQETLSTLRFGARAKKIENKAVVNRELTAAQLKRMLDSAKDEIERLQCRIRQLTGAAKADSNSCTFNEFYAEVTTLTDDNAQPSGMSESEFPVCTSRKLSNASVASHSAHAAQTQDSSRISALLEERASEQARLQQLRAEVAQLQDTVNAAQETITTLQEERDGCFDKIRSFQEEIRVWETAHNDALHRAATQAALLQQCRVLLHTQSSEIRDLVQTMQSHAISFAQARAAVEASCSFHSIHDCGATEGDSDPDAPKQRRRTLIAEDATSLPPVRHPSERPTGRLSGGSNVLDGESPNPRRQLVTELGDVSIVLPQTSRSQQRQGPHTTEDGGGISVSTASPGLSPARAAVHEWRSQNPSLERQTAPTGQEMLSGVQSPDPAAQGQRILFLEAQLTALREEHSALQQEHKTSLAELESKRRILDLRRSRLENMQDELKSEYRVNKELRERLEKEREAVRAPLEMARNDANYWRRRFEEVAHRNTQLPSCASDNVRSSLRFVLPPPPPPTNESTGTAMSELDAVDGGRRTTSATTTTRSRLSFPHTPSRLTSCRGSGEDILLSLSSHSTPVRTRALFPASAPARESGVADGAKATVAYAEAEEGVGVSVPPRSRSTSRNPSPSAHSKL
jgi:peptidoglycan hydrolase CwlO-like protein